MLKASFQSGCEGINYADLGKLCRLKGAKTAKGKWPNGDEETFKCLARKVFGGDAEEASVEEAWRRRLLWQNKKFIEPGRYGILWTATLKVRWSRHADQQRVARKVFVPQ